jgi:hypothetical protein
MNRRLGALACLSAVTLFAVGPLTLAQESKPPMHMHKSEMDHRPDKEVATEYKSEATQLREKADSHRKLAQLYRGRTPAKGGANYETVAKHCDKLAKFYEDAAKEAEGVAAELAK